jgi:hypothetical protein
MQTKAQSTKKVPKFCFWAKEFYLWLQILCFTSYLFSKKGTLLAFCKL